MVRDQRGQLLKQLANRLIQEQNSIEKALICLVLAEDFQEILDLFTKQLSQLPGRSLQRKLEVLKIVDKLLIIKDIITKEIAPSVQLDRIFLEAAIICYDEGEALLAYNLLVSTESTQEKVQYMKCLVAQSTKELKDKQPVPFKIPNIPVMQKSRQSQQQPGRQNQSQQQQPAGPVGKALPPSNRFAPPPPKGNVPPPPPPSHHHQEQQ